MQCKFCKFHHTDKAVLLKHLCLHHRGEAAWPCIHTDCVCTFRTVGSLKSHLCRVHKTVQRQYNATFYCWLCEFKDICSKKQILIHLHHHLRNKEAVCCPFLGCSFKTNHINSFSGHIHSWTKLLVPFR